MSRMPNMGQTIYDTIVSLRSMQRVATRPVIAEIIGQPMSVVDYHIKALVSNARIRRVLNGVYEPIPLAHEDRAVSFTLVPGHTCKLEIGDVCLELSWSEARMVNIATAGTTVQFANALANG